ncbi:MAG TPA: hypothetical protein PLC99_13265 [Verrucomicrobiota bacterium]|nr:hypothetical protein [Verrucomicrobiota bacterium]
MRTPDKIRQLFLPHAAKFVDLFRGATYATRMTPSNEKPFYLPAGRLREDGTRDLIPFTPEIAVGHLNGYRPIIEGDKIISQPIRNGIYPIVDLEWCWWVGADLDNHTTLDPNAVRTLVETCWLVVEAGARFGIRVYLERSAGGNGVHLWVFFSEPVPAASARRLLFRLIIHSGIIETVEIPIPGHGTRRAFTIANSGGAEFDRLVPSHDELPPGKLGYLLALPYNGPENWYAGRSAILDLGPSGKLPPDGSWPVVRLSQFLASSVQASRQEVEHALLALLDEGISDEPPSFQQNNSVQIPRPSAGLNWEVGHTVDWETFLDEQDADSKLAVSHKTAHSAILKFCPFCGNKKGAWISLSSGWMNCWHQTCIANHEAGGIRPSVWSVELKIVTP